MLKYWHIAQLSGLIALSTCTAPAQTVSCSGVPAWNATTSYAVGAQVTYQNGLYKALVSTANVPPNYCPACGWWQFVGNCGTTPTCTTVAAVPTGLASSNITTTSATVSWSAVSAPANCTVTYNVYRDGTQVATGLSGTSTTLSGLAANTTYAITVASVDAAGTSAKSTALSVKTLPNSTCTAAPSVPTGLTSPSQTTTTVNLSWTASTAGSGCSVTYKIFQGGTQVATSSTTSATISGLTANTTYSFTVASVDSAGTSAQSSAVSVKTQPNPTCSAAPSVPTGLSASGVTSSSVNLAWTASTAGSGCSITYNVYRSGTLVSTVPTTSAVVTGLSASTAYTFTVASVDSFGTSAQSGSISVTTSPINTTTLPKHLLTGYWQNFNNGAKVLRISDVPTTYSLICVAFADATTTPGAVTFNLDTSLGFTEAQFIADIATVKARGQHVIISVGGQNGTISVNSSSSATNFANSINTLIAKYGFEGVDIDLENGVNATYMAQALRAVKSGSIITMAPQTIDMQSTGTEYFKLALSIKDILTIVNMQFYNSGTMLGYDGKVYAQGTEDFLTALATIELENGLRPDQVGLGLPASPSGAGGGYVSPSVVDAALNCLATGAQAGSFKPPHTYPAIRGAMDWSINWDASSGYAFANGVSPTLNSLP